MAQLRIGVSGWRYAPWRGVFYPAGLPQRLELWYLSQVLPSVEINGSFYSLQRPEYYQQWHEMTPDDFVFAVKGPRYITHMKRLREVETPLANFFASGVFNLRHKLGPVLWQLPPNLRYQRDLLARFLELLPRETGSALALARKRDARMKGRARLAVESDQPLRHALEIRHESFLDPTFIELLREHGVALVVAETARRWPLTLEVTSDFLYLRLHGDTKLYQSGYSSRALDRWAERIRVWQRGGEPADRTRIAQLEPPTTGPRDVYCYFDNTDVKLRAPADAQSLMRKLGLTPGQPASAKQAVRRPRPDQRPASSSSDAAV